MELGASPRKASRKSLGSITKGDSNDAAEYANPQHKIKSSDLKSTQDNFSKPLILVLIGLVLFFIIVGIFVAIFSDNATETNLNSSGPKISEISETKSIHEEENSQGSYTLKLYVSGETELLIIDDEGDEPPRDFKNLASGWSKDIRNQQIFSLLLFQLGKFEVCYRRWQ